MQGLTLLIYMVGSLLVLFLKPARALAVYLIALLIYPTYLVVRIGTLDISAVRIIVSVLLLRCLLTPRITGNFKWCRLDSWVVFWAIITFVIPLFAWRVSVLKALENRSGELLDTLCVYLVARFCITGYKDIVAVIKLIGLTLVPLAVLGVIESTTGRQLYAPLRIYCPWDPSTILGQNVRLGFYRSVGAFGNCIVFGASFAMFLPFVYCLRHENGYWSKLAYLISGVCIIGALSSMSSGPLMMVIIIIGCLALEHFKYLVKPFITFAALSCLIVDIISNRNFYDVIASYADPIGGSGAHRAKLIHLAIEHFDEWWLAGYGGQDPGWGESLGMTWTDITNHYIIAGVQFGILSVIAICGMLVAAIGTLDHLYKSDKDETLKTWYWAFGSLIIVLAISFNAIAFAGQAGTIFYCILGMIGSLDNMLFHRNIGQLEALLSIR